MKRNFETSYSRGIPFYFVNMWKMVPENGVRVYASQNGGPPRMVVLEKIKLRRQDFIFKNLLAISA